MVKVHIAMLGQDVDNVVNGVVKIGADELYPITSENFKYSSIGELRTKLPSSVKIHRHVNERELIVDPFTEESFFKIVGLIVDIVNSRRQEDADVWINITGGTNLMSGAAATGAMLTGSKSYYMLQGTRERPASIIELPFMMKSVKALENPKRKLIAEVLYQNGQLTNEELVTKTGIPKKSVSKHTKMLEGAEIVRREREGRFVKNELTDNGKITARLMMGGGGIG